MSGATYYREFLAELEEYCDPQYREFHKKLLKNDNINLIGVRIPQLRKLAKKHLQNVDGLLAMPDEYYEVTFVKLTAVSLLGWEEFLKRVESCVALIDNWATCDCFVPKCILKHKQEFLPYVEKYALSDGEYYQRFALTTLLHFYVDGNHADVIREILQKVNTKYYYVHMAAAWLIAEMLVKDYDNTVKLLQSGLYDIKTHNKAIQKACESFRLTKEQKNFLKGMKK